MPNPKGPPVHTRFKKGQSGNPGGKPKLPPELKAIKEFTANELQRIISKYFRMNKEEIVEAGTSESLPMIEVSIARTIHVAAKNGDFYKLLPLVERVCGKVTNHIEHSGEINQPQVIVTLPDNGRNLIEGTGK